MDYMREIVQGLDEMCIVQIVALAGDEHVQLGILTTGRGAEIALSPLGARAVSIALARACDKTGVVAESSETQSSAEAQENARTIDEVLNE